jgi:hypothetical protein
MLARRGADVPRLTLTFIRRRATQADLEDPSGWGIAQSYRTRPVNFVAISILVIALAVIAVRLLLHR